jgi:uncharacterized protein YkwD
VTRLILATTLCVLALIACSGRGPQKVGTQPSWRGTGNGSARVPAPTGPVTFAPSSTPVSRYNEPLQAPPRTPLGDATIAAVREAAIKAGTPVPVADARLFRACSELAEIVPEEGIIAYSFVEFAMQRNGIIEPSPHMLLVWGDIDSPQVIVEQLAPRLADFLNDGATARMGIGTAKRLADGTGVVVLALQGSGVATTPIPRSVKSGATFTVDAVVDSKYRDPEMFVTRDTGVTERLDLKLGHAGGFITQITCGAKPGRQQVEITATGAQGSTVLANFPVWCGTEPPLSITLDPSHDDHPIADPLEAEKRLLAMVNRDRNAAGLPGLIWDDRVAEVSRTYSAEMRRTKVVAHLSPTSGSAADRVRAGKIKTAVVLENVARAYGINEAHLGLMNSPGHRANIMSITATHLGIGVVFGDEVSGRKEIFITQVFTRVPPKVDPAKTAEQIRQKLIAVKPMNVNGQLVAIAQQLADQLAAGKTREQAYPLVRKQVDALGNIYTKVGSVITAAAEIDSLDGASILGDARPDDIGIAIAQGSHPEIGDKAIWIVVLLAHKR